METLDCKNINQIDLPHPVIVEIDGAGNAGKTTLAKELVKPLEKLGTRLSSYSDYIIR